MSLISMVDELLKPQNLWIDKFPEFRGTWDSNDYYRMCSQAPRVDLYSVEGGVELKVDLPGMTRDELNMTIERNMLKLTGERKQQVDRGEGRWHYAERSFGKFTRYIKLPFNANPETITARMSDGVLTVSIPESEAKKENRIMIE
jgi:HSP20 family protein